ncbi:MAG: UDP-N-acetylmuramate--L-alanine ligase [Pseudomonadota bacterium]
MRSPLETGTIHFIGIGGIGMSGIAEILVNLGYTVQGSDLSESPNVLRLRDKGVTVFVGHETGHVEDAQVVVYSSAVKRDNPELAEARRRRIPVVRRAEMLAELMRLRSSIAVGGTHGKTTTTTLVASLLDAGGIDPTVINGGIINAYGTNARLGAGDWMVVEADESDGSFLRLPAEVAIVTNIDPEHLDHYGDFDAIRAAFSAFVENLPFYGFAVMCTDHPEVQALVGRIEDRTVITYGENLQADARLIDFRPSGGGSRFRVALRERPTRIIEEMGEFVLPMPGKHNALNAVAAIAVARRVGVATDVLKAALADFSGVKRRFTQTGTWNGATIIDDYGHHPVEIIAVLNAAREAAEGRVIAVVQPHRYTRLQSLFDEFCACLNEADTVFVADVFAAGEQPIPGADKDGLVAGLTQHGHRDARPLSGPEALAREIAGVAKPGDYVVCLGAGNITQWANKLPDELAALGTGA